MVLRLGKTLASAEDAETHALVDLDIDGTQVHIITSLCSHTEKISVEALIVIVAVMATPTIVFATK